MEGKAGLSVLLRVGLTPPPVGRTPSTPLTCILLEVVAGLISWERVLLRVGLETSSTVSASCLQK